LAEETCRALSRSNLIAVISHLSAREIAKQPFVLKDVRDNLAVDYCVTGSLRVLDDEVILDADFIDATSRVILWTRQFSGSVRDFLHGDGAAVSEIVKTVGRTIASDAIAHTKGLPVNEIEDHRLLVAGIGLMHQLKLESVARSRAMRWCINCDTSAWINVSQNPCKPPMPQQIISTGTQNKHVCFGLLKTYH
jgi:hypothetical protein